MKVLIIITAMLWTTYTNSLCYVNHNPAVFNIDNLLIQKDFMLSQSSIFNPGNFEINLMKNGFSVKLDTITDIVYFSVYTGLISSSKDQFEVKKQIQHTGFKETFATLWNASSPSNKRKVFKLKSC